jgi:integrase
LAFARLTIFCQFFGFVLTLLDSPALDEILQSYLQYLYDESLPMCWGADVLSSVQDMMPRLRRELPGAWRYYSAWQRLEPAQRAKPLLVTILQYWLAFLIQLITEVNLFVVLTVIMHMCLVFHLLRPAEVRRLQWSDLRFTTIFKKGRWQKNSKHRN